MTEKAYAQRIRPWPYGFLDTYWKFDDWSATCQYCEKELAASAQYVLDASDLNQRTKKVMILRFQQYKSYSEIAKEIGVSTERVRQIIVQGMHALWRNPIYRGILASGVKAYLRKTPSPTYDSRVDMMAEAKIQSMLERSRELKRAHMQTASAATMGRYPIWDQKSYLISDGNLVIEELELTVRTYNALKRRSLNKVQDILDLENAEKLMEIRNLGMKSYTDVIMALKNRGYDVSHLVNRSYLVHI